MDDHYPTIDEPATVDYVLAVLRDEHRQQCEYDFAADPDASLSMRTTVAEWREACDLIARTTSGEPSNRPGASPVPMPSGGSSSSRKIKGGSLDVCALIARHAIRRRVRPCSTARQ